MYVGRHKRNALTCHLSLPTLLVGYSLNMTVFLLEYQGGRGVLDLVMIEIKLLIVFDKAATWKE